MEQLDFKAMGQRIKELRESKNLSQSELALALGVSEKKMKGIESGETKFRTQTLFNIAVFFNAKSDFILLG